MKFFKFKIKEKNSINNIKSINTQELSKLVNDINNIISMIINNTNNVNTFICNNCKNNIMYESINDSLNTQIVACDLIKIIINKINIISKNLEPNLSPTNIYILSQKCLNIMINLFSSKNLKYTLNIDKNKFDVDNLYQTDETWLFIIIMNFLINAKKYTLIGEIKLDVILTSNNYIKFTITDTGKGIPKNKIKLLFNKKKN
jgi:signal transduction histidine kinase